MLKHAKDRHIAFTHREEIHIAHTLAKMMLRSEVSTCWIEEGPDAISNLLLVEKLFNLDSVV